MSTDSPRVRIAPSPTGYLHVGTARTAIFNYLFARHHGGAFLVRIEDTDVERSKKELTEPILSALKWLGIEADEEITYQSSRLDHYGGFAKKLLDSGHAYRCFCSPEQLARDREEAQKAKQAPRYNRRCLKLSADEVDKKLAAGEPFAIRLQIPDGETSYDDMVSGTITRQNEEIEDLIIARSNGSATYNLAVVVDDHEMGITHVIRGNDHVTNTFKQIQIYRAFGWNEPTFGHVPLILRPDKKKVSKRLGDKDVQQYQSEGILPEAMFNYLSMLGWSPKSEREIYTRDELIKIFTEKNFNASNAIFDEEKLVAFNKEHIQLMSDHDLATIVAPMLVDADITSKYWLETRWEYLRQVVGLLKERVRRMSDFVSMGAYFFTDEFKYDPEAEAKQFTPEAADLLKALVAEFDKLDEFSHDNLAGAVNTAAEAKEVKRAKLIHPTRLAVSGTPVGPGLYDLLEALGRTKVLERLRKAIDYIEKKHQS